MTTRVHRFSDEAVAVANILATTCVLPDAYVLDALRTIHKHNPTPTFREFISGVTLARTIAEAARGPLS